MGLGLRSKFTTHRGVLQGAISSVEAKFQASPWLWAPSLLGMQSCVRNPAGRSPHVHLCGHPRNQHGGSDTSFQKGLPSQQVGAGRQRPCKPQGGVRAAWGGPLSHVVCQELGGGHIPRPPRSPSPWKNLTCSILILFPCGPCIKRSADKRCCSEDIRAGTKCKD